MLDLRAFQTRLAIARANLDSQTGAEITLPGRAVAELRVDANFGNSELNEGSVASLVSGSLKGYKPEQLVVRAKGAQQ